MLYLRLCIDREGMLHRMYLPAPGFIWLSFEVTCKIKKHLRLIPNQQSVMEGVISILLIRHLSKSKIIMARV